MDEAVIKYYRNLLRTNFRWTGEIKNPSIFLDSVGEGIPICAHIGQDYLYLYITIIDDIVTDYKYVCSCDPAANVAVEILGGLSNGKSLSQVMDLKEDDFIPPLGGESEELRRKAAALMKLLRRGISRYRAENPVN